MPQEVGGDVGEGIPGVGGSDEGADRDAEEDILGMVVVVVAV